MCLYTRIWTTDVRGAHSICSGAAAFLQVLCCFLRPLTEHTEQLLLSSTRSRAQHISSCLVEARGAALVEHMEQLVSGSICLREHISRAFRAAIFLEHSQHLYWSTWSSCSCGADGAEPMDQLLSLSSELWLSTWSTRSRAHRAAALSEHVGQLSWSMWSRATGAEQMQHLLSPSS